MKSSFGLIVPLVAFITAWAAGAGAQDALGAAVQLYWAASYEESLAALDRLKDGDAATAADLKTIDRYRALCLLALGRQADADRVIEQVVSADPYYVPPETELPPRVVSAYRDARRRVLPQVAEQRYAAAKSAFDQKDFITALEGFTRLLNLLQLPEMAQAEPSPVSDIRTLSATFLELCKKALEPPPAAPPAAPPATSPAAASPAAASPGTEVPAASAPAPAKVHGLDDAGVTPPVTIRQVMPPVRVASSPMPSATGKTALLEIVIDQDGKVETAVLRPSLGPVYDEAIILATKGWLYKPAVKDGRPVKFRKLIQIKAG